MPGLLVRVRCSNEVGQFLISSSAALRECGLSHSLATPMAHETKFWFHVIGEGFPACEVLCVMKLVVAGIKGVYAESARLKPYRSTSYRHRHEFEQAD